MHARPYLNDVVTPFLRLYLYRELPLVIDLLKRKMNVAEVSKKYNMPASKIRVILEFYSSRIPTDLHSYVDIIYQRSLPLLMDVVDIRGNIVRCRLCGKEIEKKKFLRHFLRKHSDVVDDLSRKIYEIYDMVLVFHRRIEKIEKVVVVIRRKLN